MGSARLQISRADQPINKRIKINLFLDGKLFYSIANGESKVFEIAEGDHFVIAKIDWHRSNKLEFTLRDGETVNAEVASPLSLNWDPISVIAEMFFLFGGLILSNYFNDRIILWIGLGIIFLWLLNIVLTRKRKPLLSFLFNRHKELLYLRFK